MFLLVAAGASLLVSSSIGLISNRPKAIIRKQIFNYFQAAKMPTVAIRSIRHKGQTYTVQIVLPYALTIEKFQNHIPGLEQAVGTHIRFKHIFGSTCELSLGYAPFHDKMNYNEKLPMKNLSIPLFTPFGLKMLDFSDETCCHLLNGGATRMGKSAFIRLITTHLMRTTEGKIEIKMMNNKVTDLYMFRNIPQIEIAETAQETLVVLENVLEEAARRKTLLKKKKNVVDIKEFRQKYPNEHVPSVIIIIDEYGRFSENDDIQDAVTEIAETCGYLDIHLVIASQRPDARDVLKPRIKANILTRMAFSTTDETNSKIILDMPDAAHLGKIQGRAILLDGFMDKVQVPYISPAQAIKLLEPFRKGDDEDVAEGPADIEITEALPSFIEGSIGFTDLS
jgi:S-DNA-T family DNA segregation ATPase FtsK/SpoIIIE